MDWILDRLQITNSLKLIYNEGYTTMMQKLVSYYSAYEKFWIGIFIEKYFSKDQITGQLIQDINRKINGNNLDAFQKFSLVVVLIELALIFSYDIPMLETANDENRFLYLGYLYSHIFIISLTVLCNILLYVPNLSAYKELWLHHRLITPIYSFIILVTCAYMDSLNYYATKSMNLFIIVMFIQLVIFIFSLHFLLFHIIFNFLALVFFLNYYNAFDAGALNASINIGILMIFAFISGYLRLRGFVRNEIIEKQKQALDVQTKLTNAFARFVPKEFLAFLNKVSILDVELGDQVQKQMTVLFSDIRSFTTLSEKMTPQENFNFLNQYLKSVGPVIRANGGFIDKYMGDAVMALFPEEPDHAIDTALAMQEIVHEYNSNKSSIEDHISIGIGIHYGTLMLGTIGEENRMQNTVISDAVNLASRIESLTKYYGSGILTSDILWNEVRNKSKYKIRVVDTVIVKGKNQPVNLIEILSSVTNPLVETILLNQDKFENAIQLYKEKKIDMALDMFKDLYKSSGSSDRVIEVYVDRCQKLLSKGIPDDWNGIVKLTKK